jgi:hypothetical protein
MILEMFTSVAGPEFVAAKGIVDAPRDIGKRLLAMRDVFGKPICATVDDPKIAKKAIPVHICETESETWGLNEGDDE